MEERAILKDHASLCRKYIYFSTRNPSQIYDNNPHYQNIIVINEKLKEKTKDFMIDLKKYIHNTGSRKGPRILYFK